MVRRDPVAPELDAARADATARTQSYPPQPLGSPGQGQEPEPATSSSERRRGLIAPIPSSDRFEIFEAIASGGQGTVFRAYDRENREQLAIKVFHRTRATSNQALKEEFRSLSRLRHPGIVQLRELHVGADHGFFTMEYLEGMDLEAYFEGTATPAYDGTRSPPARNWNAIRLAATQLALAIQAAHDAALLHLDIKPRNIYVTTSGRVVLLDFGLVRRSSRGQVVPPVHGGTRAYMAPEQLRGAVSEKTDWYAFGNVLHQLLTGELPPRRTGSDSAECAAPALPPELPGHVPTDLAALCRALLAHEPAQRPGGKETLSRLAALGPHTIQRPNGSIVGRQRELRELESALTALSGKNPVTATVVRLSGPAGIGKTALLEHFLDSLERTQRARTFSGRCFEHAMVPYRLLDELMDRLADALQQSVIDPGSISDVAHLGRLFPRFLRHQRAPIATPIITDARHFLTQAARELAAVLQGLFTPGKPLVLSLDDVQWSDEDSIPLLLELLTRSSVPLLLILAGRAPDEPPELAQGLDDLARASSQLLSRSLVLDELSAPEVEQLLGQLAPSGLDARMPTPIASGNPLEIVELLRHAWVEPEAPPPSTAGNLARALPERRPVAPERSELLNRLYIGRLARLTPDARQYLELVCLAEQPVRCELVQEAVGMQRDGAAALQALSRAVLIRVDSGRVEPSHDTIRSCVRDYLLPRQQRDTHRALASAYRTQDSPNHEVLAYHLERAGEIADCIAHLRMGADACAAALAFERAGALYERAHALLGSADPAQGRELDSEMEKSRTMLERLRRSPRRMPVATDAGPEALARRAIECHMLSGHFTQAEPKLRHLLAQVDLPVFQSELSALRRCVWELGLLLLQGLPEASAAASEPSARERVKLDVCQSALRGYSTHATFRGAIYGLLYLRLARRFSEPRRLALGIVHVASLLTFANLDWSRRYSNRLLERGALLVGDDVELRALFHATSGTQDLFTGSWRSAYEKLALPGGERWSSGEFGPEWNLAAQMSLISLEHLGWMDVLRQKAHELLEEGRSHGNVMVEGESLLSCALAEIAADNLDEAWRQMDLAAADAPTLGFLYIHWSMLRARTLFHLYAGDTRRALQCWNGGRAALQRSGLLNIQFVRIAALALEALASAGEAAASRLPLKTALGTLKKLSRRLARDGTPYALATRHVLLANSALLLNDRELAVRELTEAGEAYARADMLSHADSARLCALHVGHTLAGRSPLEAALRSAGIRAPARWALTFAPGAGQLRP